MQNFSNVKKIIMSTSYCHLHEESWDSWLHTRPLNKGLHATLPNEHWSSRQCSSCSICFGLFIQQEWFFTNPNYTWSVTMAWVWKGRSGGPNGIPLSWGPTGMCTTSLPRLQPPPSPLHQPWKTLLQRIISSAQGETWWRISLARW